MTNKFTKLIFEDNFNQDTLDLNKWSIVHLGNGFGNNEWQFYREDSDNVSIINNQLVITCKKEVYEHRYFTSGKIQSRNKFSFKYGRVDIKAKVPIGNGLWPALWMMPENSKYGFWPVCGEIDIMESLGKDPSLIYGTIHYGLPHEYHGHQTRIKNIDDFHIYSLIWEEDVIIWLIDNIEVGRTSKWFSKKEQMNKYPAPFDQEFFLIINLAVGGNFSAYPDKTTKFPNQFIIDWVRVYQ